MLNRKVSATKRPSTMKVRSRPSNLSQGNGFHNDAPTPKTRFSLYDKSCTSPRLKSFPAEQIKRLDPPPSQNPQGNMDVNRQMQNTGQGDTQMQQSGLHRLPQPFALPNHNMSSMSEQQVSRAICPVNEKANQSQLVIPSPMGAAVNERPLHRPHVPHANTTMRDQFPRNPTGPHLVGSPQMAHQTEVSGVNTKEANQHQHRDPWRTENDSIKPQVPESDPGDRYPGFFRRNVRVNRNESISGSDAFPQRPIAGPNLSNLCPVAEEKPADSSQPQQTYQRHQPHVPNCYHNEDVLRRFADPKPDVTSPQDVLMNQQQNWHRSVQDGSHPQNSWIQDNGAQPQSRHVNIVSPGYVNPNNTQQYQQPRGNRIQMPEPHHVMQGNWQAQQQYYQHQNQVPIQTPSSPANVMKSPGSDNQQKKEEGKSKPLRFTPAMIKDQEMLVTTMRQQGVPEDVMRQQFDAMLAEQRKQLLYLEQLERGESNDCKAAPPARRVQRKISKIEEDGKPEWMLHITPPRIPYSVIEQMRNEREVEPQQPQNPGNHGEAPPASQQFCHQMAQENYGPNWQNSGSNDWQQPRSLSHNFTNANVTNQHQICSGNRGGQPQMEYYGYPTQRQFQHQYYMQQVPQESWQSGTNNSREKPQQAQRHQQAEKALEPSSLLKLRLYKEVIRQQKQNNGLQDPETVREALEALKNPANRKGLEYLDNLGKKPQKPISLNGAQDTQEHNFMMNGSPAGQYFYQPPKMPSANGLANQRNPNNPLASSILHQKKIKEHQWPEYPRQRIKSGARDCVSLVAEKENGTVANPMPQEYHASCPAVTQNSMHLQSRSDNAGQLQREIGYGDGKPLSALSRSIPLTLAEENQHQCCNGQMQQFYGNPSQSNAVKSQPCMTPHPCFPMGACGNGGRANEQQYYNRNNEIQEMIMPGGLKYFARKPEYIPNSSVPPHCNVNPGNYFHPTVPCQ